jgi:cyanophycin synthetase
MKARVGYLLARHGGRPGRETALALDLLGATGVRHMLHRRRQERELADLYPSMAVNRRIWDQAAAELGADVRDLEGGRLVIDKGNASVTIELHVTAVDDEAALERALDKEGSHRLLSEAGVAVPEQVSFNLADLEPALSALEIGGGSWVVKPAGGTSSGQGITTGIRTAEDLLRAAVRAARSDSSGLLLERQAGGEEYRLLLLDGEPIGLVRRFPPSVVGDGRSSIAERVLAENRDRLAAGGEAGLKIITLDLDALLALQRAGLSPASVPAAGERVAIKESRSQSGAADVETVPLSALSDELVAEAVAAAEAVGLRLAGIDLATPDLDTSLGAAGGAVIEINGTPGLHYHYLVREPERAERVAVPILERLLANAG